MGTFQVIEEEGGYRFREFHISARMLGHLKRYTEEHQIVGEFLQAVLRNDLRAACALADEENLANLPAFVAYLYNEAPSTCWGTPERVKAWLNGGTKT